MEKASGTGAGQHAANQMQLTSRPEKKSLGLDFIELAQEGNTSISTQEHLLLQRADSVHSSEFSQNTTATFFYYFIFVRC
jgi:hypothetical protein